MIEAISLTTLKDCVASVSISYRGHEISVSAYRDEIAVFANRDSSEVLFRSYDITGEGIREAMNYIDNL